MFCFPVIRQARDVYKRQSMYGSKYVCKLNEACVEQARYSFTDEQGQPRYMACLLYTSRCV